ncbi:YeeE/YedE family protein [Ramlibacter sp. AW1]|uniref:YeeE/YedE family protein n=1 Tax=Ramlibacter aurantiacus TaxID=2801330 RepID=A0A936ZPZ6_9BURK|nr:YeeE/YedE family protein [Ramlibacter aurantiacus]MBL0421606.1 YeeE/YedE family protein [Ramlibacter aurantiacus]
MHPDLDPSTLALIVVWGALILGLVLGVVAQASRFCVRGAIADWVAFRGPARLVSWLLAVAVGAVCVQALVSGQLLDAGRTIYWSERFPWLSYGVGGVLFGYGMILAGGCPQRCLVKAGQGSLKAAITLVVVAIAALMTLRGAFAPLRVHGLDAFALTLTGSQDLGGVLGQALGLSANGIRWAVAAVGAATVFMFAWRLRSRLEPAHWVGGIAVGALVGAAFFLTGTIGFVPEHPETLEAAWLGTQSKRPEGLSFSAPMGHALDLLTLWSDKATVATFGVMVSLGVVLGAFASAKARGEFRLESFRTPRELLEHVGGGLLMGFGGVTALGCSVGNGVTGLAMLSTGSMLAVLGISAGAWLALAQQMRAAERAERATAAPARA